jgi:hypothetical protein
VVRGKKCTNTIIPSNQLELGILTLDSCIHLTFLLDGVRHFLTHYFETRVPAIMAYRFWRTRGKDYAFSRRNDDSSREVCCPIGEGVIPFR